MLAQQLFFIFLFSMVSNPIILFSMEKPDKAELDAEQLKLYNKALRYVAAVEKARKKPHPKYPLENTLAEIDDEIQQKIRLKLLKQADIGHLAEKEIGLQNLDRAMDGSVSVVFQNSTTSTFYINNTKLEPKKTVTTEAPLLHVTHRLSHMAIPIYDADTIQIFPLGPCITRNSKKLVATLEGARSQMIPELPEQTFYTHFTVSDAGFNKQSNIIDGDKNYHSYVILTEKLDARGNGTLESFVGVGLSHYEAARHAQEQHEELVRKLHRQKHKATGSNLLSLPKEITPPLASSAPAKEPSGEEQSIVMKDNSDEASTVNLGMKNPERTIDALPRTSERSISASQSTTSVKPAYPPAKQDASKGGSLIYGSLRRAKQAIERTVSLKNVKEVKKEPTQP